ncbi:MAG: hypothetical protein LBV26_03990 [Bacteroidales bacterium]|jgi:hypothetical protein|nr:hypothetical protein [Bacteroidales bacterium]
MNRIIAQLALTCMFLFVLQQPFVAGQEREGMEKYTPGFRFKDGVYVNFEQVRQNSPVPKAKLLSTIDYNDADFFRKLFENDKVYYYDDMGTRQEIAKSQVWGYSRNGILYIRMQEGFSRITFIGSICHFVADITTEDRYYGSPYSPYGYYDPYYYSPYSYYSPYYYSPYSRRSTRTELKQFIIDWESGRVMNFDVENTNLVLMKDHELHEEFARLSRKKKRDMLFVFIRKYDEKHPLYVPAG